MKHVPRAHEVKNQRVIAKRTSQIMQYGHAMHLLPTLARLRIILLING